MLIRIPFALMAVLGAVIPVTAEVVDFDDLSLAPDSYWKGPDPNGTEVDGPFGPVTVGSFQSRGVSFENRYDQTYGSWNDFAYSNTTDTTTPGFFNETSAYTGTGRGPGADNYGVAFGYQDLEANLFDTVPFDPTNTADLLSLPSATLPDAATAIGMYVTNTTYAGLAMLQGNSGSKQFGGLDGNDADWFKLSIYGLDALGMPLANVVDFYLADYRFTDNALDYIIDEWSYVDLTSLSGAKSLHFNLSSSDRGDYGMNTPSYFALDDLEYIAAPAAVPEPSVAVLFGITVLGTVIVGRIRRRRSAQ